MVGQNSSGRRVTIVIVEAFGPTVETIGWKTRQTDCLTVLPLCFQTSCVRQCTKSITPNGKSTTQFPLASPLLSLPVGLLTYQQTMEAGTFGVIQKLRKSISLSLFFCQPHISFFFA